MINLQDAIDDISDTINRKTKRMRAEIHNTTPHITARFNDNYWCLSEFGFDYPNHKLVVEGKNITDLIKLLEDAYTIDISVVIRKKDE